MALRELNQRQNDMLLVELLWDDELDVVVLRLTELESVEHRTIDVVKVPAADAADAFRHPERYLEREAVK